MRPKIADIAMMILILFLVYCYEGISFLIYHFIEILIKIKYLFFDYLHYKIYKLLSE